MTRPAVLTCQGRAVDNQLQHHGDECGRTYATNRGNVVDRARARGWLIIQLDNGQVTATCDRCRQPPDAATQLARQAGYR